MIKSSEEIFFPLLGDLSGVPSDYITEVSMTKRFLERWTMDPAFRARFDEDPETTMAHAGVPLEPDQVIPFIDRDRAVAITRSLLADGQADCHRSVLRYRAFIAEKIAHRGETRKNCAPDDPVMARWRKRQINRCVGELGRAKADAIVHAPAAFEISKGCTVGCWFCGVAAPKFDHTWPYTAETGALWRSALSTVREVIGKCAQQGFIYWATDPLDNPDYEKFLADFYRTLGRCPQTTTAQGQKNIERTAKLLRLAHSMDSDIDRFSIISLNSLSRIHDGFTAEELLRIELVPQNREASLGDHRKANAGRARKFAAKRGAELTSFEESSTIACVSGFLFNMIDRSVRLITPCNASERWPLGYWVLARGSFDTAAELRDLLSTMIREKMKTSLHPQDVIRLRPDVRTSVINGEVHMGSRGLGIALAGQSDADGLASSLTDGCHSAEDIALNRERTAGVPLVETLWLLGHLFDQGLLDEEPCPDKTSRQEDLAFAQESR